MKNIFKKITLLLCLTVSTLSLYGENTFLIKGVVLDHDASPLIGANVIKQGSTQGTITDLNGEFSLEVDLGAILIVSFIGYETKSVTITGNIYLEIVLNESAHMLENVIVTALGIKKKESSLTYSAVRVGGDELSRNKEISMMNALAGKAAGVMVNKSSAGIGSSSKVLIRGTRTVASDNQPLYVIDGVPILNSSNEQAYTAIGGVADSGNRDGGDGISNINPEDIESISILKGAPAAALYGSDAANGVILITTKKGSVGQHKVVFSTNLTFDKAFCLPSFQNTYGESDGIESWGEKSNLPEYDHLSGFYHTGVSAITSVAVSSGNDKMQTYFSYANSTGKGIIGSNRLTRHNINLRETTNLFNNRLNLDGNVNFIRQNVKDRPASGGFYMNSLVGLYRFPRGKDLSEYKNVFEVYDPARQLMVQNWHSDTQDFEQNPYWVINRIHSKDQRNRMLATLSADIKFAEWFKIKARTSVDYANDKLRQEFYATTAPALTGLNGRYVEYDYNETLFYSDVMALFEKNFSRISLNSVVGFSFMDKTVNSLRYDSKNASLKYPNIFNIANINMNSSAYLSQQIDARRQMQSLFATVQAGYHESIYLDLTARNDWSSTLAFTPHEKSGYFYPSVGLAWIINKTFCLPKFISFAKIRLAGSKVGNDIPQMITYPMAIQGAGGEIQLPDAKALEPLKPEMTTALECGMEWRMWNNRIGFSLTYYKTNTRDQFFTLPSKSGETSAFVYVNAGNIQNTGWEGQVEITPYLSDKINWKTILNFSANRSKVISLHAELPEFIYGPRGFSSSYAMKLKEGGAMGDIYGKAFKRDEKGNILYEVEGEKKGLPQIDGEGNTIKVGNCNPKFNLGWNNSLNYKNFYFSFLIDCRFGGDILSQTQADLDLYGVTPATAQARNRGYVSLEGHRIEDVEGFYKTVAGRAGVTEYYMYDATNIRLRELTIGYSLPTSWIRKSKFLNNVVITLVARNLFFIYKKAPFDPDLILSTGNDNQGIEIYGVPITRSVGFNVKCEF